MLVSMILVGCSGVDAGVRDLTQHQEDPPEPDPPVTHPDGYVYPCGDLGLDCGYGTCCPNHFRCCESGCCPDDLTFTKPIDPRICLPPACREVKR